MKTIVEKSTGVSKYLFEDDETLIVTEDNITVGNPVRFRVHDLNSNNTTITENVTNAPSDWYGCKYTFDGTTWAANPDWVEPDSDE